MVIARSHQCFRIINVVGDHNIAKYLRQHKVLGPAGRHGPPGPPGLPGPQGAEGMPPTGCSMLSDLEKRVEAIQQYFAKRSHSPRSAKQVGKTCADLYTSSMTSGFYTISPNPSIIKPFKVQCKVVGNRVYTVFGHDSEAEIRARDCESPRCSVRKVKYNLPMATIRAVAQQSTQCRQFIKYRCRGSLNNYGSRSYWSWRSFNGKDYLNWGGSNKPRYCACGITGTCKSRSTKCNCDINGGETSDYGYLTGKNVLPVIDMRFGDLGGSSEKGWHTLGKLECY